MASNKVDVWNLALTKIGETKLITSEDDDSITAKLCALHWDTVLKEVLERRHWRFARTSKP